MPESAATLRMKSDCTGSLPALLRIRFQQRGDLRIGQCRMQPAALVVVMQDDRHPAVGVVDVAHHRIGLGGYDRDTSFDHAAVDGRSASKTPGQGEDRTLLQGHVQGDFPMLFMAPSVESAHGNQTPSLTDRNPERRVFENGFRTGVDRLVADRHDILRSAQPIGNQPPPEILYLFVSGSYRIREVRKGTYMVCRSEFSDQIGFTAETPGQFFGSGSKGDMITHGTRWFILLRPAGPTAKKSREHNCGHSLRFSYGKNYFVAFVKLPSLSKSSTVLSARATL